MQTTNWFIRAHTMLAVFAVCASVAFASPSSLTLTILHDNDLHGHILPFPYTFENTGAENPSVGGAARRATLVRRLRHDIPNPTILIDAGDIFTRGPMWDAYRGIADIDAMNAIGYDLATIGNNEFKDLQGIDASDAKAAHAAWDAFIERANFPWICANVANANGDPLPKLQPYVIRTFNGVRVGFLGISATERVSLTKDWKFTDYTASARRWIPIVRSKCDILIAVTHIGLDDDKKLVEATGGIDAVIGAHSHTFLWSAIEAANDQGQKVPIVQAGEWGAVLGQFDLHLCTKDDGKNWRIGSYDYKLDKIDGCLPEAPDVKAIVDRYAAPLRRSVGILSTPGEGSDSETAQLIVDAMRSQTGADYALNTRYGGMEDIFRSRNVTLYDIYAVMPFHYDIATTHFTGSQLLAQIDSVKQPALSGDRARIDPARIYTVALIDFVAVNNFHLTQAMLHDTGLDLRKAVIAAVSNGRMTAANSINKP